MLKFTTDFHKNKTWYQHKIYEIIISTLLVFIIIIKRTLFALFTLFVKVLTDVEKQTKYENVSSTAFTYF